MHRNGHNVMEETGPLAGDTTVIPRCIDPVRLVARVLGEGARRQQSPLLSALPALGRPHSTREGPCFVADELHQVPKSDVDVDEVQTPRGAEYLADH